MTLRKPLVIVNGQIQQLQAGDTLDAVAQEVDSIILTNGEAGAITIGQVVYIFSANTVKKARADAGGTAQAFGLVAEASVAGGATGQIQTSGVLSGLSALTAGAKYYLDPTTSGAMTATAPTTPGQYVVPLGRAISTTEFKIDIEEPILL
jgi:hypothetical protein